jgi:hypothetical protein
MTPSTALSWRSHHVATSREQSEHHPAVFRSRPLEQIHIWLDYSSDPGGLLDTSTVHPSLAGTKNIYYDAKGQRLQIFYNNGANSLI